LARRWTNDVKARVDLEENGDVWYWSGRFFFKTPNSPTGVSSGWGQSFAVSDALARISTAKKTKKRILDSFALDFLITAKTIATEKLCNMRLKVFFSTGMGKCDQIKQSN
jgi:hypothetical protein